MNTDSILKALSLPSEALLGRRIPKKMLMEQGGPTAADRRRIRDGIEKLTWTAVLKPGTVGTSPYRDDEREFLEVSVLSVHLRVGAAVPRLVELIHRAVPYHVLLLDEGPEGSGISVAHKRFSQGEAGKVVVEQIHRTKLSSDDTDNELQSAFLSSLALTSLPTQHLLSLYQAWVDRISAMDAAHITGTFAAPSTEEGSKLLEQSLQDHARLTREIAALRAQARKEKQLRRRVEQNISIKELEAELASAKTGLQMIGETT